MISKSKYFFSILFLLSFFIIPSFAYAADFGFSPSNITRNVGSTFSVIVYVSSPGKAINAVSGTVSFPTNKLEVLNISKINSVINLWVEEPTFSNTKGTVNFEGIALNPGFSGNMKTIINISFRAKSAGVADVKFSSGSILANDGTATDVLQSLGNASFSIQDGKTEIPKSSLIPDAIDEYVPDADPLFEPTPEFTEIPENINVQPKNSETSLHWTLSKLIELVLNYLSAAILVMLALAGLVGSGTYLWHHSIGLIRRLRRENMETEKMVEKSFHLLRNDLKDHIAQLKTAKEKRKLTSLELDFLQKFDEELAEAREIISKEMKDSSK